MAHPFILAIWVPKPKPNGFLGIWVPELMQNPVALGGGNGLEFH